MILLLFYSMPVIPCHVPEVNTLLCQGLTVWTLAVLGGMTFIDSQTTAALHTSSQSAERPISVATASSGDVEFSRCKCTVIVVEPESP